MPFLLEHDVFTHSLVSLGLPLHVFPFTHLLVRLSVPLPHVTEHDQGFHEDQTIIVYNMNEKKTILLLTSYNISSVK